MKKKLITGIIATLACLTCFTGCELGSFSNLLGTPGATSSSTVEGDSSSTPQKEVTLDNAIDWIKSNDLEKVQKTSNDYTLPTKLTLSNQEFTITWTTDNAEVVISEIAGDKVQVDIDNEASADVDYNLTATVKNAAGAEKSFTVKMTVKAVSQMVPREISAKPVEGKAYKFHVYQGAEDVKKDCYINGKMENTYFFQTVDTFEEGINVYVDYPEGNENEFYLVAKVDGADQYINIVASNGHTNAKYEASAVTLYRYDETEGKICTTFNGSTWFLGCDGSYDTVEPQIKGTGVYLGSLSEMVDRNTLPAVEKLAIEKQALLSLSEAYVGTYELALPTTGATYKKVEIEWTTTGAGAVVENNTLKLTAGAEISEFTLTATLSLEGAKSVVVPMTAKLVPNTEAAILEAGEGLTDNGTFGNEATLTGVVTREPDFYQNEANANLTFRIAIADRTMGVYRVGVGSELQFEDVKEGSTVSITGIIGKHSGQLQFTKDSKVMTAVDGTYTEPYTTAQAIYNAADALARGEVLDSYKLTGVVTNVEKQNTEDGEITSLNLTIDVDGVSFYCYKLEGKQVSVVKAGDTLTVEGNVMKHSSVQFASGSYIMAYTAGEGGNEQPGEGTYESFAGITAAPEVGKAYIVVGKNSNGAMFLTGEVNSNNQFVTSADKAEAVSVYVEETTGGLLLYVLENNAPKYFIFNDTSDGAAFTTDKTAASVMVWSTTYNTLIATTPAGNGNNRGLGLDATKNFNNFKCYDTTYSNTYTWAKFVEVEGGETPDPEVPPTTCEHVWDEGEITTQPTCLKEGVKTFTCTLECGTTKTEPVAKVGHNGDVCSVCTFDSTIVATPVNGTTYYFGLYQHNESVMKQVYFAGDVANETWYLATTQNKAEATPVVVEVVEGKYFLSFQKDGTTMWIYGGSQDGKPDSGTIGITATKPATGFDWDAEYKTFTFMAGTSKCFLGTRNDRTFETLGSTYYTYVDTNCVTHLYTAPQPTVETVEVTIPTGDGFEIDAEAEAVVGEDYTFTVTVADGYQVTVYVGDTAMQPVNDVYTVENVAEAFEIKVVVKKIFNVVLATGDGFEVVGEANVLEGNDYTFKVNVEEGYEVVVSVGETVLQPDNGVYTIVNVTANVEISVTATRYYTVTMPESTEFIVSGETKVAEGATYTFTVVPAEDVDVTDGFEVKVNGETVEAVEGKYTVESVNADLTISVALSAHVHNYDERSEVTPGTCQTKSVELFKCACGDSYTQEGALNENNHVDWDEGVVTTEPTCVQAGVKTFTCACGETKTEEVPANEENHTWGEVKVKAPTCLEEGYSYKVCMNGCGTTATIEGSETEKLAHADDDGDVVCDTEGCEEVVLPEANSTITLEQAKTIGLAQDHNTQTTTKYYMTGTIKTIDDTYGNVTFEEIDGFETYGIDQFKNMLVKPAVGDTITVYGTLGRYNSKAQTKYPTLVHDCEGMSDCAEVCKYCLKAVEATAEHETTTTETKAPTCSTDGVNTTKCANCSYTVDTPIPSEGHKDVQPADGACDVCGTDMAAPEVKVKADFETINKGTANNSYTTRTSTAGWVAVNAQICKGGATTNTNSAIISALKDATTFGVCLNGHTSKVGKLTSPTITSGVKTITFNWCFPYSETFSNYTKNNVFEVTVTNGTVTKTTTFKAESTPTKEKAYEFVWALDEVMTGECVVTIKNLSASNNAGNKDRLVIWNLTVSNQ